jgi:hypothetical protein
VVAFRRTVDPSGGGRLMTGRRKLRFAGVLAVGGGLLAGAGIVPAEAASSVYTTYAWGYQKAPNYYDLGQGSAAGSFNFTVTNLTSTPIDTTVEFIADRIISFEGINVTRCGSGSSRPRSTLGRATVCRWGLDRDRCDAIGRLLGPGNVGTIGSWQAPLPTSLPTRRSRRCSVIPRSSPSSTSWT